MTDSPREDDRLRTLRWGVYTLLIAAALGQAMGKIAAVNSVDLQRLEKHRVDQAVQREREKLAASGLSGNELRQLLDEYREKATEKLRLQRPFLSANDRSRWLTVRALAENGTFEIDPLLEEPTWDTIDMVQHPNREGEPRQYSSKPPLLMVLLAGPYWAITQISGATLGDSPYVIGRGLLMIVNGGALVTLLLCVALLVERFGVGEFDRLFAMAAAAFGTQLSAFAPVLNNHLIAAAATGVACVAWSELMTAEKPRAGLSFLAGLTAAFATACELPALSLLVFFGASLLWKRAGETLRCFTPAALLVAVAFFATNYWAHNSLKPPYAHRNTADTSENWYDYEYTVRGKTRDSYWRNPAGIDRGEGSKSTYALHVLVGHHGVFSLTPVWLLSFCGMARLLASKDYVARQLALITLAITGACLVFYIGMRPQADRNYGGMTSGFRWLFWVAPLWLAMTPAGVRCCGARPLGRAFAATLLAFSAFSASYPTWNPWSQPWIYRLLEYLGFTVL